MDKAPRFEFGEQIGHGLAAHAQDVAQIPGCRLTGARVETQDAQKASLAMQLRDI